MMQLTYLTFTAPRKDAEAFESFKNRMKAQLESAQANPSFFYKRLFTESNVQ